MEDNLLILVWSQMHLSTQHPFLLETQKPYSIKNLVVSKFAILNYQHLFSFANEFMLLSHEKIGETFVASTLNDRLSHILCSLLVERTSNELPPTATISSTAALAFDTVNLLINTFSSLMRKNVNLFATNRRKAKYKDVEVELRASCLTELQRRFFEDLGEGPLDP